MAGDIEVRKILGSRDKARTRPEEPIVMGVGED